MMNGNQQPFDADKKLAERLDLDFALRAAGLGVWELDPVTNQIRWDDRCRQLFGIASEKLMSYEQALAYVYPDDVNRMDEAVRWAMDPVTGGVYDITYRTIGADGGELRWVHFWGQGYFTSTGEVTQQVENQQHLEQSQRQVLPESGCQCADGFGAGHRPNWDPVQVGPLPSVQGDASQLGQLLVSNALKFCRHDAAGAGIDPQITIRTEQVAAVDLPASVKPLQSAVTYHRIEVADNGIGFEQKYADRIFHVFQRLHGKGKYTGTGIGLAICEKVVANHGGAITASSQPGQGATFSVYLPV